MRFGRATTYEANRRRTNEARIPASTGYSSQANRRNGVNFIMKSQCLLFDHSNHAVRLGSYDVPELRSGEILVRTAYSSISPGTELRCLAGNQPGTPDDAPYIPGYANVGTVIESRCGDHDVGSRVFCGGTMRTSDDTPRVWGGHCEFAVTDSSAIKLPESLDPIEASLTALGGIAYHGFTLSKPRPSEKVVHVGLGVLGHLSARIHATAGADVLGCDLTKSRVAISNAAGIRAVHSQAGISEAVRSVMPDGCSLVVDTTGAVAVISPAINAIGPWLGNGRGAGIPLPDPRQLRCRFLGAVSGGFYEAADLPRTTGPQASRFDGVCRTALLWQSTCA